MDETSKTLMRELRMLVTEDSGAQRPSKRRERLLRAFLAYVPPGYSGVVLLWLVDDFHQHYAATLWSVEGTDESDLLGVESYPGAVPLPKGCNAEHCVEISACSDQHNAAVRAYVAERLKGPALSERQIPIVDVNISTKQLTGYIHIISDAPSLMLVADEAEKQSAMLFGTWLTNDRNWRILNATRQAQKIAFGLTKPQVVAARLAKMLADVCNATRADIFIVSDDNSLHNLSALRAGGEAYDPCRDSFTSRLLFNVEAPVWRFIDMFDAAERRTTGLEKVDLTSDDICGMDGGGRVAWLSVCTETAGVSQDTTVPFLMVRMLTHSKPGHLGGSFSKTHVEIVKMVTRYLADILPALIVRERMQTISQRVTEVHDRYRARINEHVVLPWEREFCAILQSHIPAVRRATPVIYAKSQIHSDRSFNPSSGVMTELDPPFNWTHPPRIANLRSRGGVSDDKGVMDATIHNSASHRTGIRLEVDRSCLARYQHELIQFVTNELRIATLSDLDIDEKMGQIAEIRHALRAGLTGVVSHLGAAMDIYKDAEGLIGQGDVATAHRLIFEQAAFRKSMEKTRLAGHQVSSFFEDTRILLADLTPASLQLTSIDLAEIVREIRVIFQTENKRRKIEVIAFNNSPYNEPWVVADRNLVQLSLFNLIDNAVKYSFSGNNVNVIIGVDRNNWLIRVENVGRHIPPQFRNDIFEPFRRVASEKGVQEMPGTGIGLWASRRVARLHGGEIKMSSVVEDTRSGTNRARTAFTLELPRARYKVGL